ncbi:MAG: transporter substrate-binding domain-containing protein [Colwellia sp.]|nr:transporter substrate-binding domain-containing protein [Colwellia sp.]
MIKAFVKQRVTRKYGIYLQFFILGLVLLQLLPSQSYASQKKLFKDELTLSTLPANKIIHIALPTEQALNNTGDDNFHRLVKFLKEYWQIWAIDHQQPIKFVHMSSSNAFIALRNKEIDIAAVTVFNKNEKNILYSIPYAKFQQRIFRRLASDEITGTQLAIHSSRNTTLDFLGPHVDRRYYKNVDDLLIDHKQFNALYSTKPWLLTQKLNDLGLMKEFYISTDEAPTINFHFATHASNRNLLYLVNNSLRMVSKAQANLWKNKYATYPQGPISLTIGSYLTQLSETEKQYIIDHNQLYFPVTKNGFPPYIITKGFANITERGFAIDLIEIAQQKLGIIFKPTFVDTFDLAIDAINNHQADFFVQVEANNDRKRDYNFSVPYLKSNYSIIYRYDYSFINNINELSREVIAVVSNFNASIILKKQYPKTSFIVFATIEEAISAVSHGEASIFIGRSLTAAYIIKQQSLSNLTSQPLAQFHLDAQFTFATLKANKTLITLFNRTINSITADQFDDLYAKWSKSAFSENNAQRQIDTVYRQAAYILSITFIVILIIFWIYYRRLQIQKSLQKEVESALTIAEQARNQAEELAKAKITFLARMSHEIRTPMNGVLGMAEALTFTKLDANQQELLGTLRGSARNLLSLLNDVLDFSKMDAGELTLEDVPVNFHLLTKNIMSSFSHIKRQDTLKLHYHVDDKITHNYLTDPTRITQVLNNLISNAIKFTEDGEITVSIKLIEQNIDSENITDTLQISIQDSGIGIAKEQQSLLFTPFKQADSDVTRKYGGTGLGLSICQEIVTAMGSIIKLESTLNIGSKFHFILKLKQAGIECDTEDRRKNTRLANAIEDDRFKNLRILVAEDNLVNIKVLTAQLMRININADVAQDGEQALDMHTKCPYDIIISDCHMPKMDGFELARNITQSNAQKPVWLIAITADALAGAADNCLAAGFNDYMAKPCSQEDVTNKLNNAYRQLMKASQNT